MCWKHSSFSFSSSFPWLKWPGTESATGNIKACRGGSEGCKSETGILELPKESCPYIRNMFILFKWYCMRFGTHLWLLGRVNGIGGLGKKKKKENLIDFIVFCSFAVYRRYAQISFLKCCETTG